MKSSDVKSSDFRGSDFGGFDLKGLDFEKSGHTITIARAPQSMGGSILAQLAQRHPTSDLVHIAPDDRRARSLLNCLAFFAPDIPRIHFPAWDCPPYSRIAPDKSIIAARLRCCDRLAHRSQRRHIIVTTAAAILQKLPPPAYFRSGRMTLSVGEKIRQEDIEHYALSHGYQRADSTRENGEFSRRGSVIDLFSPHDDHPLRIDFFGDDIEDIRTFDPASQRSIATHQSVTIIPASAIPHDASAIDNFRASYASLPGEGLHNDNFHHAVVHGAMPGGIEHWMALFHDHLVTFDHYFDDKAILSLDEGTAEKMTEFLSRVHEYYHMRQQLADDGKAGVGKAHIGKSGVGKSGVGKHQRKEAPARIPPPQSLYLDTDHWKRQSRKRRSCLLTPFARTGQARQTPQKTPRKITGQDAPVINADIMDANIMDTQVINAGIIDAKGKGVRAYHAITPTSQRYHNLALDCRRTIEGGGTVLFALSSEHARKRWLRILHERGITDCQTLSQYADREKEHGIFAAILDISKGFTNDHLLLIGEEDLFGSQHRRSWAKSERKSVPLLDTDILTPGELVVHRDHGIGRYDGLMTLTIGRSQHDCLKVLYRDDDRLFVPVENIDVLSRYGSHSHIPLDRLGGTAWITRREDVKKRLRDLADHLLKTAARRNLAQSKPYHVRDGAYEEFCARFPFPETPDQRTAIENVLSDLSSGKPMDRLVCADVGFGKTEIALRAAFVVASQGAQIAILTPTTLLARQHYATFQPRFADFPVTIAQLSRFTTAAEAKNIRQGLQEGSIDIVIGTHALLSERVQFHKLGLAVIDEEQHFGVQQKERLRHIRAQCHVLSLSATPIPRTLQFSLSGVRDMSLVSTPPNDRLSVHTFVTSFDSMVIRQALMREHQRQGQSFYIVPRIDQIESAHGHLGRIVPELDVIDAHGGLANRKLEKAIGDFYDGKHDILLATAIVESGLDIPRANTLIVQRADMFGLAQLHQIRGRIGRSDRRGWAYFLLPHDQTLSKKASQRLEVLSAFDSLGAGFSIAAHDLDLRGGGNLLGAEQSGHIREVGAEMYQRLLHEAISSQKKSGESDSTTPQPEEEWSPQIHLDLPVLLPATYIPALDLRLTIYRRAVKLKTQEEIEEFGREMRDRFGVLPVEASNFLAVLMMKQRCLAAGIEKIEQGPKGCVLRFRSNHFANVEELLQWIGSHADRVRLRSDHALICRIDGKDVLNSLASLIEELTILALKVPDHASKKPE